MIVALTEIDSVSSRNYKIFLPIVSGRTNFTTSLARDFYNLLAYHPDQEREELTPIDNLINGANYKALDLGMNAYFAHRSPYGVNANRLARSFGNDLPDHYSEDGNSIESLLGGTANPLKVLEFLLASPSHRNHLLGIGPFFAAQRYIGIGYAEVKDSPYTFYWCIWITELE